MGVQITRATEPRVVLPRATHRRPAWRARGKTRGRRLGFLVWIACAVLAGCRAAPPAPLRAPQTRVEVGYYFGSPISGGVVTSRAAAPDPASVWGMRISVFALEQFPRTALEPLAPRVQLVTHERGSDPIAPVARVIRGRVGEVEDAALFITTIEDEVFGRSVQVTRLAAALAPGVTTTVRFRESSFAPAPAEGELRVWRAPEEETSDTSLGAARFAFALEGLVAPLDEADDDDGLAVETLGEKESTPPASERRRPGKLESVREVIFLRPWSFAAGHAVAFLFRFPFSTSPAESLAVVAEMRPRGEWTDAERVEFEPAVVRCFEEVTEANALVRERRREASAEEDPWSGYASALAELSFPARQRPALVYLAQATGSRLVEELALSATDDLTAAVAAAVQRAVVEEEPRDPRSLAWLLTRAMCEELAARTAGGKAPVEVESVLALHTGEVGRHVPVLEAVTRAATGLDDFHERLIQENFTYLEDISPAARARALRWLAVHGRAPEGYDPLASFRERRLALARTAESPAGTAATAEEEAP